MNGSAREADGTMVGVLSHLVDDEPKCGLERKSAAEGLSLAEAALISRKAAAAEGMAAIAKIKTTEQQQSSVLNITANAIKSLSECGDDTTVQKTVSNTIESKRRNSLEGIPASSSKAERRAQLMEEMGASGADISLLLATTRTTQLSSKRLSIAGEEQEEDHHQDTSNKSFSLGIESLPDYKADNQKLVQRIQSVRNLMNNSSNKEDLDASMEGLLDASVQNLAADNQKLAQRIQSVRHLMNNSSNKEQGGLTDVLDASMENLAAESLAVDNEKLVQRIRSVRNLMNSSSKKEQAEQEGPALQRHGSKKRPFFKGEQPLKRGDSSRKELGDSSHNHKTNKMDLRRCKTMDSDSSHNKKGGLGDSSHNKGKKGMRRCKTIDSDSSHGLGDSSHNKAKKGMRRCKTMDDGGLGRNSNHGKTDKQEDPLSPSMQRISRRRRPGPRRSSSHDLRSSQIHQALKLETQKALQEVSDEEKEEEEEDQTPPRREEVVVEQQEDSHKQQEDISSHKQPDLNEDSSKRSSLNEDSSKRNSLMSQFVPRFSFGLKRNSGADKYGQMDDSSYSTRERHTTVEPPVEESDTTESTELSNSNEESFSAIAESSQMETTMIAESSPSTIRKIRQRQRRGFGRKSATGKAIGAGSAAGMAHRRQGSKKRLSAEEDGLPPLVH